GVGPGKFTSGDPHLSYRVELELEKNIDPGNVQGWEDNELTMWEILDSGLGLPDRRAMLWLAGKFKAQHINPDGSITNVRGHFDAGDQVYLCKHGIEAAREALRQYQEQGLEDWDELDAADPEMVKQKILEYFKQQLE